MRDYEDEVKSLDDNVGRVLDYLKEKGLLDNTLVVYTSDQRIPTWANTVSSTNVSYTKNPCVHPLIMRLPKGFDRRRHHRNGSEHRLCTYLPQIGRIAIPFRHTKVYPSSPC